MWDYGQHHYSEGSGWAAAEQGHMLIKSLAKRTNLNFGIYSQGLKNSKSV